MSDANVLFTKMGVNLTCESVWRVGKTNLPNRPLVMKLRIAMDRATLFSTRAVWKVTKIYLDDDLTLLKQKHKREDLKKVTIAREDGKSAIYQDGRVIICEKMDKEENQMKEKENAEV